MERVVNVVFAGLGGQGAIKASDILADAACRAGHDVKKAEIHGMSQRGGSVTSDVRYGEKVLSPMVPRGEADYLVALDHDFVDEKALANKKSLNVALLGALSHHLAIPEEHWLAAVRAALPARLHEVNEKAFRFGRETAARARAR
jgi:indolepyruvate ferredoxin oxidoreductase beta subunit